MVEEEIRSGGYGESSSSDVHDARQMDFENAHGRGGTLYLKRLVAYH